MSRYKHSAWETAQAVGTVVVVVAIMAACWFLNDWNDRRRARIYAEEFQRRGMAPQAVPK